MPPPERGFITMKAFLAGGTSTDGIQCTVCSVSDERAAAMPMASSPSATNASRITSALA